MRRPTRRLVAGAVLVPVAAGAVWLAVRPGKGSAGGTAPRPPATAVVARTTLVEEEQVDATLGYAGNLSVVNQASGTITRLAAEGEVVDRGQVLYEVDGRPVRLLVGTRPAWRALARGVPDGPDVRQLEENLVALGHATSRTLRVDDAFGVDTTTALERWQKATGAAQDGVVNLGEVVFLPGAVRVSERSEAAGSQAQPGKEVLEATSAQRVVTVDLDARKQDLVKVGDGVEIRLPNGKRTRGRIAHVSTVAEKSSSDDDDGGPGGDGDGAPGGGGDDGGDPTVEVVIAVDDPAVTGTLDQAPVKVGLSGRRAEGVLAVPVNALLALAEGGYAVEVVDGAGRRLVRVDVGMFARGLVEVRAAGLSEGARVVVPS